MLELIEQRIADIQLLIDLIAAAELKTAEIMMTVMANDATIAIIAAPAVDMTDGSIELLTSDTTTATNALNTEQGRIDTAVTDIMTNANFIIQQQMDIVALAARIDAMAASGDFYGTNSQALTFDMNSGVVDGAEFCVPTGVPFEFYSSMSTMSQINGAVSALQLVKASDPTTVIVESSQDEMLNTLDMRDHNYSINYKGVGDGSPFQVYYSAVQGAG